ncbi:MAG: T9SS type A sorting domain-containing protein [Ignavibacteria bacterium]|nr:T9SS type A sorting domain-containing protein [Ignavibacteria bacterium]
MRAKKGTVLSACLALALLCAVPRAGAQYRFSGTVLAMDSVPVANAIMQLRVEGAPARTLATKTDAAGRFFFDLLTGVEAVEHTNGNFERAQGFPNPFTDGTSLRFSLPQPGAVRLAICDLLGRALRVLTDDFSPAGTRIVPWDGRDATGARVPPGLYFAVLQTEQRMGMVKLVHAPAATQTTAAPGVAPPLAAASPLPFGVDTLRVSLSVVDTLDASPRFFTMRHMFYALAGDSDVTIRVYDSSAWRFLGLGGVNVRRLVLHDSILYACTANYGLAWRNVYSDTAAWRHSMLPGPNGGDIHDLLVLDDTARTFLAVTGEQYTHLTPIYRSSSPDGPWLPADSGLSYGSTGNLLKQGIYRIARCGYRMLAAGNRLQVLVFQQSLG